MRINQYDDRPIFLQVQEGLETAILQGAFPEESQIPSTTELSMELKINPATALKGINGLVDQGVLYKKRGIGVFVKEGAVEMIHTKRKGDFRNAYIDPIVKEAKRLDITLDTIIKWLQEEDNEDFTN